MKHPRISLVLLVGLFFICQGPVLSQAGRLPGYVVTLTGDTLQGSIVVTSEKRFASECEFYHETYRAYKPGEIMTFAPGAYSPYHSIRFRLIEGRDSVLFLKEESIGRLNLFSYVDNMMARQYVVGNLEKGYHEIAIISYLDQGNIRIFRNSVGALRILTTDCPDVIGNIDKLNTITPEYLTKTINKYNQCLNPDLAEKKQEETKNSRLWSISISGGSGASTLNTDKLPIVFPDTDDKFGSYPLILSMTIENGSALNPLFFRAGLLYHYESFTTSDFKIREESLQSHYNLYRIRFSTVSLPFSIRYSYLRKTPELYITIGMAYNKIFYHSYITEEKAFMDKSYSVETDLVHLTYEFPRHFYTALGGLGAQYKVNDRIGIRIEGVYHYPLAIIGSYEITTQPAFRPHMFDFLFGFNYNFLP